MRFENKLRIIGLSDARKNFMSDRILNNICGRLSLRPPQRESLEALKTAIDSTVVNNVNSELLNHKHDVPALLDILKS